MKKRVLELVKATRDRSKCRNLYMEVNSRVKFGTK